jgi:hypothetical protein
MLVKGILPQAILEYLKVYDAVLMANNRFCIDSQCPSSLSLCGDAALESIRLEVSRLVGFLPFHMRPLRLLSLLGGLCEHPPKKKVPGGAADGTTNNAIFGLRLSQCRLHGR